MSTIPVSQLTAEIVSAFREYTNDVSAAIDKEVETTADLVLADAQQNAPKRTGKYAKGFTKTDNSYPGKRRFIIWNKKYYSLVHLLEFGHALKNGGRVAGKPHLRPAYDKHINQMTNNIKQIIKNGG